MSYRLYEGSALPSLVPEGRTWEERRPAIEQVWREYVGAMPDRVAPHMEVLAEHQEAEHRRLHIRYAAGEGDYVTAYLLIPGEAATPAGKHAAVLALHPTHPDGKGDIATVEGRASRAYGLELVRRGFVVLAPDTISAGERIYPGLEAYRTAPFYEAHPGATAIGKMLHDHQQGLDLLQSLPYVDNERIGAIGHSLGAYNAFMLAGWDRRIKAVVSSCGLSPFTGDPDPGRWGQRDWFSHLPRISEDLRQGRVPFEMHEIAALAAPTPMLQWSGQQDKIFPHWEAIASASLELGQLYQQLDIEERYVGLLGNAGHDFPPSIRMLAYDFLAQWLAAE